MTGTTLVYQGRLGRPSLVVSGNKGIESRTSITSTTLYMQCVLAAAGGISEAPKISSVVVGLGKVMLNNHI